jgi:hypothetical protein
VRVFATAYLYTSPETSIVWGVMEVVPRPEVPVPSDVNVTVAVPALCPAEAVLTPTLRLELLLDPAAMRPLKDPDTVAVPVAEPMLASSDSE